MALARLVHDEVGLNSILKLPKGELPGLIELLCARYDVYAPVRKGTGAVFERVGSAEEVLMDYRTTLLPPKKLLHRPLETLFRFNQDGVTADEEGAVRKRVIFGIHPCDAHAIMILDKVYGEEYPDPYYLKRRQNTLIVGLNCTSVGENCFCASLGTGPSLREGYDLLLTDLGKEYLVEVGSQEGVEIALEAGLRPAPRVSIVDKEKRLDEARACISKRLPAEGLSELLRDNFRHPIWEELKDECLACGSCTMVCPTCFCYNVMDKVDLSLKEGTRQRAWDSCMLLEYAQVALGHNFRKDRDARIKQRVYHKLVYYEPQFGTPGCVGCGRCIETCIKGIDITHVARALRGD